MKLKVLTEAGLGLLEDNIPANIKHYQGASNKWIYEFLEEEHIKDFHTEVADFELKVNKKETAKADVENVKMVYGNLKFLTNEQASDNRFWTGLTHLNFWGFMRERWNVREKGQVENNVMGRYFVGVTSSHRRSLLNNTLSKYWWVGRQLYDKEAEDPFRLLKFFEVDYSTKAVDLLSSNYANNNGIVQVMVEAFVELEIETGRRVSREEIRKTTGYLNILGGLVRWIALGRRG
ncbi:MAG TPA: hypothetical protein GX707_16320 [Epulopiscium sp.]|nr:hypothetical protein [Candidatus Epulonipiscium sp.]